jgi:hypothetical protein
MAGCGRFYPLGDRSPSGQRPQHMGSPGAKDQSLLKGTDACHNRRLSITSPSWGTVYMGPPCGDIDRSAGDEITTRAFGPKPTTSFEQNS